MTTAYLVVREDRHYSMRITVHLTIEGAEATAAEFRDEYDDAWTECVPTKDFRSETDEYGGRWLKMWMTDDDGPSVRIESAEVRP